MTLYIPSTQPIRIGLMGLGSQSQSTHLPAIAGCPAAQLVAACDCNQDVLAAFKQTHAGVMVYEGFQSMLAETDLDAVIVALPHQFHFEATRAALSHGLHVLKEKPAALTCSETAELTALARRQGIQILIGTQRRFNPYYQAGRTYLNSIGRIFLVDGRYSIFTHEPHTGWRGVRALAGGGCLIDMGYHILDVLIWYFGVPQRVFCDYSHRAIPNHAYDAEDTARIMFRMENRDFWGSLLISRVMPPKQEYLHILGTEGGLMVSKKSMSVFSTDGEVRHEVSFDEPVNCDLVQMKHFIDVVHGAPAVHNTIEQHLDHAKLIEACYHSVKQGQYAEVIAAKVPPVSTHAFLSH